jgi:hypothetical protein
LAISNPGLKAVSSNASSGGSFFFFLGDDKGFLKEGVKTYPMTLKLPLDLPAFFCLHMFTLWYLWGGLSEGGRAFLKAQKKKYFSLRKKKDNLRRERFMAFFLSVPNSMESK